MALILNIETSATNCSVSAGNNGKLLSLKEHNSIEYSHSENLHVFIREALQQASLSFNELDAVAVSCGPGSYTGLRIGVSTAKGLCFVLDKPLISVDTLQSMAFSINVDKGLLVPMLDARRMEVYSAVFNSKHKQLRETRAEIIDGTSFANFLNEGLVYFFGPGAVKCKGVITHPNAVFVPEEILPSAKYMVALSEEKFTKGMFEDVAYFQPFYLKDFAMAGKSFN